MEENDGWQEAWKVKGLEGSHKAELAPLESAIGRSLSIEDIEGIGI